MKHSLVFDILLKNLNCPYRVGQITSELECKDEQFYFLFEQKLCTTIILDVFSPL